MFDGPHGRHFGTRFPDLFPIPPRFEYDNRALMQPLIIQADRAFTPFEEIHDAVVVVQGSQIKAVGSRGIVDLPAVRARLLCGEKL